MKKSKIIQIAVVVILVAVVSVGGFFLYGKWAWKRNPVGCLNSELIYSLDEFKNAQKQLDQEAQKIYKDYEEQSKNVPDETKRKLYFAAKQLIDNKTTSMLLPLKERANKAVASIANQKKMSIILDKNICVTGAPDITEDVIKVFKQEDKIKSPETAQEDKNALNSPIGYFNQEVIYQLKVFQEAEAKLYQTFQQYQTDLQKKAKNLSKEQQEQLIQEYEIIFNQNKEKVYSPLYEDLNRAIEEVGKSEKLSIILDSANVMYGGVNVTDQVVKAFLDLQEK